MNGIQHARTLGKVMSMGFAPRPIKSFPLSPDSNETKVQVSPVTL